MQHERALQSNELIDFNFRAVLSLPDVFKLSSFAGHKLVTLSLVFFVFFFQRQVAILEMLFLNVLKASVVRWMLSLCGCFLCGLAYTCF